MSNNLILVPNSFDSIVFAEYIFLDGTFRITRKCQHMLFWQFHWLRNVIYRFRSSNACCEQPLQKYPLRIDVLLKFLNNLFILQI